MREDENMAVDIRKKALRLLELIDDKVGGRTDAGVIPDNQMAAEAGLEYVGSDLYNAAIRWLLAEEALQQGPQNNALLSNVVGTSPYGGAFKIKKHGQDLLRQAR